MQSSVYRVKSLHLALTLAFCSGIASASLLPNGSFEAGTSSPEAWEAVPGPVTFSWTTENPHRGVKAVSAQSASPVPAWRSAKISLDATQAYIVEGWLKVSDGEAWLSVDLTSESGQSGASYQTPHVKDREDWTYVAVETQPQAETTPGHFAVITFHVHGKAVADDLKLTPYSPLVTANAGFEMPIDKKGRIPMWDELKEESLLAGKREGTISLDTTRPKEGASNIVLAPTGGWIAVGSIPCAVPMWTDRCAPLTWARCEGGAQAQLLALWADDYSQHIVRVDQGLAFSGTDWQPLSTPPLEPPAKASNVKIVLVAHAGPASASGRGRVHFDSVDLRSLPPQQPSVRVLVNQVGYDQAGPKSAIVASNFFPTGAPLGTFQLETAKGRAARSGELACAGRMYGAQAADWGWYFWRASFSDHKRNGEYRVRATLGAIEGVSYSFRVEKDLLFRETGPIGVDFFFVQRCGFDVPGWFKACHLDDAKLPDGTHLDLIGGWHSAGDYNKLPWEYGDGGVLYSLVTAAEAAPRFFAKFDRDGQGLNDILDEAWWGAKYQAKIQVPETGGLLNHVKQGPERKWMKWAAPDVHTDSIIGTEDDPVVEPGEGNSPLLIGAWARTAELLQNRGIANDYLARAIRYWEYVNKGAPSTSSPHILTSTLELYRTTRESRFLDFARRSAEEILAAAPPEGQMKGGHGDSGDIPAGALALFALRLPDDPLTPKIRARLAVHLPYFVSQTDNPLRIIQQKYGADGFYFEPTSSLGHNWEIACRAWSALLLYQLLGDRRAWEHAIDQLDFILGKNPYSLCMMEGKGTFNPPRYHHRYNAIPGKERGAVPGAIPNGFVRDVAGYDRPGFDLSTGGRQYPSYRTSEPWLVHNVWYMLAVTALHEANEKQ
ncbi:MAG: glycoside hydrolase family 9 protein [Candidatus Hydrogenedentes bacterium]|nr:glycoside hydrolase family 9 protein [Candidatus Hydrogenedentota bacterium]